MYHVSYHNVFISFIPFGRKIGCSNIPTVRSLSLSERITYSTIGCILKAVNPNN